MPFVPVKCTSCGGEIQLDDTRESGFCLFCGSKVVFEEAKLKMILQGDISVKGIADLDKLLQNAETFHKMNEYKQRDTILLKITNDYPEDYHAWYRLFRIFVECLEHELYATEDSNNNFTLGLGNLETLLSKAFIYSKNAVVVAPLEVKQKIHKEADNFLQETYNYVIKNQKIVQDYEDRLAKFRTKAQEMAYVKLREDLEQRAADNNEKVLIRRVIKAVIIFAWIITFIYSGTNNLQFMGPVLGILVFPIIGIMTIGKRTYIKKSDIDREFDLNTYSGGRVEEQINEEVVKERQRLISVTPSISYLEKHYGVFSYQTPVKILEYQKLLKLVQ